jgi:hypothetical protein
MFNYFFKNLNTLFLTCALAFISIANAQEVRVIDNKGTIKTVNNNQVITGITAPADPILEGDVWFDTSATPTQTKIYDGSSWVFIAINETITTFSQETATPTGVITYINEAGASSIANTVSADADNQIVAGTDGGAYLNGPEIIAAGKVGPTGINFKVFGVTVTRVSLGNYQVTFVDEDSIPSPLGDANYIIQLTIISALRVGNDDADLSYYDQQTTGFKVQTGDNDNGSSDRSERDFEFMFTVIDF